MNILVFSVGFPSMQYSAHVYFTFEVIINIAASSSMGPSPQNAARAKDRTYMKNTQVENS